MATPLTAETFGEVPALVPRDSKMYARIFHPVERDRPRATKSWQDLDEETYFNDISDIEAALVTEWTSWANVAAACGTTMHAEAQYPRLVRRD